MIPIPPAAGEATAAFPAPTGAGGDFGSTDTPALFPFAAGADVILWRGGKFTGSALARTAFRLGPSGDQALQGTGALSMPEMQTGSLNLGGYIDRDPGAALPTAFSLGLA
ncbi:MAG: hypothetical protein LC772_09520, partial [Chloroflexi bacterium]|nr:hypothetical protein [Chloroflexota bacterium]